MQFLLGFRNLKAIACVKWDCERYSNAYYLIPCSAILFEGSLSAKTT